MKKSSPFILLMAIFVVCSCEEPLEYRYQDKPQLVDCPGADKALMHEALYSFQEDIGAYYGKYNDYGEGTRDYYIEAYTQFIYFGFSGEADFKEIASPHTLKVLEKLKKEKQLWNLNGKKSNLNYDSEYVSCLLNSIKDDNLRQTFASMKQTNYLDPKVLAEPMRTNLILVIQDSYLAMYTMLDAYYQYLMDIDLSETAP